MVGEELTDSSFLDVCMCFWKCKMCWNLTFFAEIEVVHLYQPFGSKLEVLFAISQGGTMLSAWWL